MGATLIIIAARRAAIERCEKEMIGFQDFGATPSAKRAYAECVSLVHQQPIDPALMKIIVGMFLVILAMSIFNGWRLGEDFGDIFMYSFFTFCMLIGITIVIGCVIFILS